MKRNPRSRGSKSSLTILQPYVFPYLAYFQIIGCVDTCVFLDDVAYIKGGWINRNAILCDGVRQRFTIPVLGASPNREIREVLVSGDPHWKRKLLATVEQAYSRAPFFEPTMHLVEDVLHFSDQPSIAGMARRSILSVSSFLGLETTLVESSSIFDNQGIGRSRRLIDICRKVGATTLVNPKGGDALYSKERFQEEGVDLQFLRMCPVAYPQFGGAFVPNLSIIDVLMFNGREGTRTLLGEYDLV